MFVGEIGIVREEYLYRLKYVDLLMILRGYDRRQRYMWSAMRWQTFSILSAFADKHALKEAGLFKVTDLIRFPWEREATVISKEDVADLQAEMASINAKNKGSAE